MFGLECDDVPKHVIEVVDCRFGNYIAVNLLYALKSEKVDTFWNA
jgi:hypothetical protein